MEGLFRFVLLVTAPRVSIHREEAAAETAKKMVKEGKVPAPTAGAAAIAGVGLARAAGMADAEAKEAAEDERYLRKVRGAFHLL